MNRIIFGLMICGMLFLNSCMVAKKVVYVNDMVPDSAYRSLEKPTLRVQKGDRLSIVVRAKTPELAAPFNTGVGAYKVDDNGNIVTGTDPSTSTQSYLVDQQGNITFPILGDLLLEGKSLDEVKNLIEGRLIKDQLINDPQVKVEMINLKVSVMGAVKGEQVLNVPDARITLLEAIAQSGGLTDNAAADRVVVIREENGVRKRIVNNIESKAIFDSPTYYLQQNDIVFVEPKAAVNTPKEERSWRLLSTTMGAVTIILTALNLLK
jgi:polysaccharide export outer membrane protein